MSDITCAPCATHQTRKPILKHLAQMIALAQQRRALRTLTLAQRIDIGITKTQADAEADKPIWDVPHNWKQ